MSKAKQVTLRSGKVLLDEEDGRTVWIEGRKDGYGRKTLKWRPGGPDSSKELSPKELYNMIDKTAESLAELEEIKRELEK